jgi:hypothetical protein
LFYAIREFVVVNRQRWITATVLGCLLVASTIAFLAFTAAWTPDGLPRCFTDVAHSQFPKWLGCAFATHEALAGSLIAAGAALFGAWLAFVGLQDQIGLAQKNEREANRLAHQKKTQEAARDFELVRMASGFVKQLAEEFPPMDITREPLGRFGSRLLDLRRRGGLRLSENAAGAPDGIGESVRTIVGRLNTLADNVHEETKNLTGDARTPTLHAIEPEVVRQVEALHQLAAILQQKVAVYELRFRDAAAESTPE